jgi:hypothetical protein
MKFLFYSLVLCAAGYLAYTQSHVVQDFADDLSGGKAADVVEQAEDVSGQMLWTAQEQIERWRSSQARVAELEAELKAQLDAQPQAALEVEHARGLAESIYAPQVPVSELMEDKRQGVDPDQLMALIERMEMKAAGY